MPVLESTSLGQLEYAETDVIRFPFGLPGFDAEKAFLAVEHPEAAPLVYLQSIGRGDLLFLALPVEIVDANYELRLMEEYRTALGMDSSAPGRAEDLLCLALLCVPEQGTPTANLLGPVVIHRGNRVGVQAIRDDARYSAQQALFQPC